MYSNDPSVLSVALVLSDDPRQVPAQLLAGVEQLARLGRDRVAIEHVRRIHLHEHRQQLVEDAADRR